MTDFEGLVASPASVCLCLPAEAEAEVRQRTVVTGGASGIGAATARLLQERGAAVAVLLRTVDGAPDGILAMPRDVTDAAPVQAAVAAVADRLGGLGVVVDDAGMARVTRGGGAAPAPVAARRRR